MTDELDRATLEHRLRDAGCVFAEEEAALIWAQADGDGATAERLARGREGGLPLEQVLGWAELAGVRVGLTPGVFVPRRRTTLMVEVAVGLGQEVGTRERRPVVLLDLCCGSGAVAAAVAHRLRATGVEVEVTATDVDAAAVACAAGNLPGARVRRSDLFTAVPDDLRGRLDLLTANVPYVPSDAVALLPREAREHEPRLALDGGADGLDLLRRVAAEAPAWLAPGGTLLVETGETQVAAALAALTGAGLAALTCSDDDLGATLVLGARPRRDDDPAGGPTLGSTGERARR